MKKRRIRILLTVICLSAAGICYSCRSSAGWEEEGLLIPENQASAPDSGLESGPGGQVLALGDGSESESTAQRPVLYVHICGEVKEPGVYEMEEGSRIFQAVQRAGGFTDQAAEHCLNMARQISDGMKIVVPSREDLEALAAKDGSESGEDSFLCLYGMEYDPDPGAGFSGSGESSDKSSDGRVNLNTADKAALMTLNGIGESRADAILKYRQEHGPFQKTEDIMEVSGIKEGAFEKIKDNITV